MKRAVTAVLILAAVAGSQPPVVKTVPVRKGELHRTVRVPGTVLPFEQATLIAHVTGYVKQVRVREGAWVKRRDVLATIDVPLMAEEVLRAREQVRAAEAEVEAERATAGTARAQVEVHRAALAHARAEVALRTIQLKRLQELFQTKAATPEQVENAEAQLEIARAKAATGEAEVAAAQAGVRAAEADVARARARVRIAKVEIAHLEAMKLLATIRCPYERGLVTERHVDAGALVKADSTPLLVVANVERVRVRIDLNERDAIHVAAGSRLTVSPDASGVGARVAAVSRIFGAIDPRTRTMRIEADLPNAGHRLRAGMFVHADVEIYRRPGALSVPADCLEIVGGKVYVYVVRNGRAERTLVRTGMDDGLRVEILEGLSEQAIVILSGKKNLKDGTVVQAESGACE